MITVAIVAILAAIAYPSYQEHVRKGYRAQAQSFLMDVAFRQQQYFIDNRSYAADTGTLGLTAPAEVASRYNIVIAPNAGSSAHLCDHGDGAGSSGRGRRAPTG